MTRKQIHHIIYIFLLFALAAAIPVSNFVMSAAGISLTLNWILEWNWREKWQRLKEQKLALILASFFVVLAFGLIHTDNWSEGLDNLISKLPLLYAPIIMASSAPPSGREQRIIISGFVLSTFIASCIFFICALVNSVSDFRDISMFISHIRFGFSVILSCLFSIFFTIKAAQFPKWQRWVNGFLALWFVVYIFVAQTFTAILLLLVIAVAYLFYSFFINKEMRFRKCLLFGILVPILCLAGYISYITWSYFNYDSSVKLEANTQQGNPYQHDLSSIVENGSPIGIYVCEEELRSAWQLRSDIPYDSIAPTLIRYLNSKNLRKDADGVAQLTEGDVRNVENLIANVDYTQFIGIKRALYPTFFSISLYNRTHQVVNSSLLQRVALWHAAAMVVSEHWATGVGIGDHKEALNEQLKITSSDMPMNMGAHNQFLTLWIMGGVLLPFCFLLILFMPFFIRKQPVDVLYLLFFVMIFISCFAEDTIETQAGITFYTFFNAFFLFCFDRKHFLNIFVNKKYIP